MKLQATIRVRDRIMIELDSAITRRAGIKDGQLFEQELTESGDILLRRLQT